MGSPMNNIMELNSENYKSVVDTESDAQVAAESMITDKMSQLDVVPEIEADEMQQ